MWHQICLKIFEKRLVLFVNKLPIIDMDMMLCVVVVIGLMMSSEASWRRQETERRGKVASPEMARNPETRSELVIRCFFPFFRFFLLRDSRTSSSVVVSVVSALINKYFYLAHFLNC